MSIPKSGHTTSGSGRGARRGGGAGSGRTVCQQSCSPRRQGSLVPCKESKTRRLKVFLEARTSEIPCTPNAVTKSSVDNRFIRGLSAGREALFVRCRPVERRIFVSVNPFYAIIREYCYRHCSGYCQCHGINRHDMTGRNIDTRRVQNTDISRAVRGGSGQGGAEPARKERR